MAALVAHDCGYPLSRYTCRATRVAADFLDFIAFCRCSTGVALHPLKTLVSHLPPPVPGGVAPKFGSEKVSRYTGVSQLQLRVSRYTVQLRWQLASNASLARAPRETLLVSFQKFQNQAPAQLTSCRPCSVSAEYCLLNLQGGHLCNFSEDFSLLVAFLLVTFPWFFRGFSVAFSSGPIATRSSIL